MIASSLRQLLVVNLLLESRFAGQECDDGAFSLVTWVVVVRLSRPLQLVWPARRLLRFLGCLGGPGNIGRSVCVGHGLR